MADVVISKADKSRITRLDNIDSAFVMLFLVNQFHTEQLQAFSKELVLGKASSRTSPARWPASSASAYRLVLRSLLKMRHPNSPSWS